MNDLYSRIANLEASIATYESEWRAATTVVEKELLVKLIVPTKEALNKLLDQSREEHPQQQMEFMEEIRTIRNSVELLHSSVEQVKLNNLSFQNSMEQINSRIDQLNLNNLSIKNSLGQVLEMTMDPRKNIDSVATEKIVKTTIQYKDDVCSYYTIPQECCMVLGKVTNCDIICAHIWPKSTCAKGLELAGLKRDDVTNPRNFLRLHRSIEEASDKKRLCFVQSDREASKKKIHLVVLLLDPELRKETFVYNNQNHSFKELENRPFSWHFTHRVKPYLRLLALHACRAIEKAQSLGWMEGDFAAKRDRALRLASHSLDETAFNSLLNSNLEDE